MDQNEEENDILKEREYILISDKKMNIKLNYLFLIMIYFV